MLELRFLIQFLIVNMEGNHLIMESDDMWMPVRTLLKRKIFLRIMVIVSLWHGKTFYIWNRLRFPFLSVFVCLVYARFPFPHSVYGSKPRIIVFSLSFCVFSASFMHNFPFLNQFMVANQGEVLFSLSVCVLSAAMLKHDSPLLTLPQMLNVLYVKE